MKFVHAQLITTAIGLLVLPAFAQDSGKVAPAPSAPASVPATTATSAAAARSFGYYSYGGRIYRIENGRAFLVETEQTMRVGPKGVVGFDGRPLNIPEGQMIGADGRLAPLPRTISGLPTPGAGTTTKTGGANPTAEGANTVPAPGGTTTNTPGK